MGEAVIKLSPADSLTVSLVSAGSPEMPDDQFKQFIEDIRARGQLVPIWVCGGEVIDGRKRLRACRELGIEVRWVETGCEIDVATLSRSLNELRTHYARGQLAMYGARRSVIINNQRAAAREVGVSQSLVSIASEVIRSGSPEVVKAVDDGRVTLGAAARLVKLVPLDGQPEAVSKIVAANVGKRRQSINAIRAPALPGGRRMPRKPIDQRIRRAIEQLENTVGIIEQFIDEAGRCEAAWAERMRACRRTLTGLINQAKEG